ncbi:unnamed protein product [Vitrella brassicaformis CCMP3155]|uniref:Uncharacterized protein n=1 Tax=Vitrella brassicaformis (strain CCMP3155) TaxID=1169540 RepID=A0A0G4E9D1_VITBC|nr:unnamed protein product [Vitrella brassicaformis CCMP3155]|eukprot:CEL91838.1 unnamed protein product [Vitrella brassicaformis CCMP3155]
MGVAEVMAVLQWTTVAVLLSMALALYGKKQTLPGVEVLRVEEIKVAQNTFLLISLSALGPAAFALVPACLAVVPWGCRTAHELSGHMGGVGMHSRERRRSRCCMLWHSFSAFVAAAGSCGFALMGGMLSDLIKDLCNAFGRIGQPTGKEALSRDYVCISDGFYDSLLYLVWAAAALQALDGLICCFTFIRTNLSLGRLGATDATRTLLVVDVADRSAEPSPVSRLPCPLPSASPFPSPPDDTHCIASGSPTPTHSNDEASPQSQATRTGALQMGVTRLFSLPIMFPWGRNSSQPVEQDDAAGGGGEQNNPARLKYLQVGGRSVRGRSSHTDDSTPTTLPGGVSSCAEEQSPHTAVGERGQHVHTE